MDEDESLLGKSEKTRVNFTVSGLYIHLLDRLVEEGMFLTHGEVFRESLRRIFRAYGLEPFTDKEDEITVKVLKDVKTS